MRPSALGPSEILAWHQMLAESPSLQRAFLTPDFSLACERSMGRAYVAVLHVGGNICGFLPFQFKSAWHQAVRLAERIGGNMSDNAGVISRPDFRTDSASLLRAAGLGSLHINHLMAGQEQLGLDIDWSQTGYVTELKAGPDAYFADLAARNRDFIRDTQRRVRKAEKIYGSLSLRSCDRIPGTLLAATIEAKRLQYRRTKVADPFELPMPLRLVQALNDAPSPECRLVLTELEADGRALAQHLGLQHNGILSWWFPVYDPEAQGVSPGRLLLWYMIQHAAEDGIRLIDYGEGEAQYKRQFSTGSIRLGSAMWSAENARALFARAWQSIEWRLRDRPLRVRKLSAEPN
jgi:CelD/BcsL family acetyltransferase involved in cellulose biosynthesis